MKKSTLTPELKEELLSEIAEANENWNTHIAFHHAWHDCNIDFSYPELASLAESYGYKEGEENEWDEDFADECHEYMEEYADSWRCNRSSIKRSVKSRAISLFVMNEFEVEDDFEYDEYNEKEENIRVYSKDNDYWIIIWEQRICTQMTATFIDKFKYKDISDFRCDNIEESVKELISAKEKEGYTEVDVIEGETIGYLNNELLNKGFIYCQNAEAQLVEKFKEDDKLIKKIKDKKGTKEDFETIVTKINTYGNHGLQTDKHYEYTFNFKELYVKYGEDKKLIIKYAFQLAELYMRVEQYTEAEEYYLIGYKNNDSECCCELASSYYYTTEFGNDYDKAMMYVLKAIECGDEYHSNNAKKLKKVMIDKFEIENAKPEDLFKMSSNKQLQYLKSLDKNNVTDEQLAVVTEIGARYYQGHLSCGYFPTNFFEFAASCNYSDAIGWKAQCILTGYNYNKNPELAKEMIEQVFSENKESGSCYYVLAQINSGRHTFEKNVKKTFECLNKAIELGHHDAYGLLSFYHEIELDGPNPQGRFDAAYAGTQLGNVFAEINLAECYEVGAGCEKDIEKAYFHAKHSHSVNRNYATYVKKLEDMLANK